MILSTLFMVSIMSSSWSQWSSFRMKNKNLFLPWNNGDDSCEILNFFVTWELQDYHQYHSGSHVHWSDLSGQQLYRTIKQFIALNTNNMWKKKVIAYNEIRWKTLRFVRKSCFFK